jgi:alpha-L-rhamnosidase
MMKRLVHFYRDSPETTNFIHSGNSFGDWLQPYSKEEDERRGETDIGLIGTAYFARSTDLLARTAAVLEKSDDAEEYEKLFLDIRAAFQQAFFDASGKLTTEKETQTGYLLALAFDLVDSDLRPKLLQHLANHIETVADGHLRTGFLGTPLIAPVLSDNGRADLAYNIVLKETYPGWLFSINQGATTMWERWNSYSHKDGFGIASMNSFNHYAYGAIGEWMYETLAGLNASAPGYKVIHFSPETTTHLEHAEATLETPYGLAKSSWRRSDAGMQYQFVLPPNTSGYWHPTAEKRISLEPGTHRFLISTDSKVTKLD